MTSLMILTILTVMLLISSKSTPTMVTSFLISSFMFYLMLFMSTGESWFPLILMMMFLGGAMTMLMFSCIFTPRISSVNFFSKNQIILISISLISSIFLTSKTKTMKMMGQSLTTDFLETTMNFQFMMFILIAYFLGFLFILSWSKESFRSTLNFCYYHKKNFVNFQEK